LGVVLFIYESRPNVTSDAAALCLKSGNAVILRGGKEARYSNQAVARVMRQALADEGIPLEAFSLVEVTDRAAVGELLRLPQYIDVAIPRGGEELIRRVASEATMPVIKHYKGVCHIYVDESADMEMAVAITENSKCQRPGVCNAAETLLIHRKAAERILPAIAQRLGARNTEIRGCPETCRIVKAARQATAEDFGAEFLDLILAVKVVDDLDQAIEHIAQHGSGHTETIVTNDYAAARKFTALVDSSGVFVNASTRFNDGGQFGLGAEIGISTDKFHARGPCGALELTSYKYVAFGNGQVRT
jgi:glutamate-5-semialdehyde dehydrogenase